MRSSHHIKYVPRDFVVHPGFPIVFLIVVGLMFAGCERCGESKQQITGPKNLLFIVIDTLRADQLALYNGPTPTPNIERLAARGIVFDQAYAHAPITGPSHASMFTSLLPDRHGVHNNAHVLSDKHTTLAELMSVNRHTAAFVSLEALRSKYGVLRGFQEIHEDFPKYWWKTAGEVNEEVLPWMEKNTDEPFFLLVHYSDPHGPYTPPSRYEKVNVTVNGEPATTVTCDRRYHTLKLHLAEGKNTVRFSSPGEVKLHFSRWKIPSGLKASFLEGFVPWKTTSLKKIQLLPRGAEGKLVLVNDGPAGLHTLQFKSHYLLSDEQKRQGYAAETEYVDREIGLLLDLMTERDLWKDTLVVLTADHGEELGERGGVWEHVNRLYDSLIRVPLIIAAPQEKDAGERVMHPVRHVDLLPTLAPIYSFDLPAEAQGRNLWPLDDAWSRPVVSETYRPQARADRVSIRVGDHKLHRNKTRRLDELYDMATDPGEHRNLLKTPGGDAEAHDKTKQALIRALEIEQGKRSTQAKPTQADLTEEDKEALRALGYME